MAELAKNYHESLQTKGMNPDRELRDLCTHEALNSLKTKTNQDQKEILRQPFSKAGIESALNKSYSNRSPGIDGLTYELWKHLNQKFLAAKKNKDRGSKEQVKFNPVKLMTIVFNDIHSHGIAKKTNFTVGWMCPIYKKNNRNEIANYRPVCNSSGP
jgi:hypothetical protein